MKSQNTWRKLSGLIAISAVMLTVSACGGSDKKEGAGEAVSPIVAATPTATAAPSPTESAHKTWSTPPEMMIDPNKSYTAEVETNKGTFTIELFANESPKTVNNFVFLAKENFYDGVVFHRIIETFMIQTGDPTGTGRGGPGYKFEDELPPKHKYEPGTVAMANSGKNTNGSQFFIVTGENAVHLNDMPYYTIFGKVKDGMDVVTKIDQTPVTVNPATGHNEKPTEEITINEVRIIEQ